MYRPLRYLHDAYKVYKKSLLATALAAVAISCLIGFFIWRHNHAPSPVPAVIKSQTHFVILYPKGYQIDPKSWKYLNSESTLSFTLPNYGNPIVFTEQAVPLTYKDDTAAYDRFIGSLRPHLTFKVPLGNVSLVGFVSAGDYKPEGRSAVLKTNGTLLIAHPEQMITDSQWYDIFNSLKTN